MYTQYRFFKKVSLIYPYFERVKIFSLKVTFINAFWALNTQKRISSLSNKLTIYIYSKNTSLSHLLAQLAWASPLGLCRVERHRFESHTSHLFLPSEIPRVSNSLYILLSSMVQQSMVMNRLRQKANRLKTNLSNGKFLGGFDFKGSIITPSVPMISVLIVFSKPTVIYTFSHLKIKKAICPWGEEID